MNRTNRSALAFFGVLAAVFLVAGLAVAIGGGDDKPGRGPVALGDVRLVAVSSCDELLTWYRDMATDTDAGMLGGYGGFATGGGDAMMREATGAPATSMAASPGAATATDQAVTRGSATPNAYSTTNVQERDVDEPDTVKTNGDVVITTSYNRLQIVDVSGDAPALVSTVELEQGTTEILLSGDRLLALTTTWRQDDNASAPQSDSDQRVMIMPVQGRQVTVLTSIDISDPADPQVLATREIDGTYRAARATGTTARVVLVAYPQLPMPGPAVYESQDQVAVGRRLEEWKADAISSMTIDDWVPGTEGDCSTVTRTSTPEGLGSTTVLTFDLQGSLDELDRDTIVADAGTVYASPDRLVIATSRWSQTNQPKGQVSTELHSFAIDDPATTSYVASGETPGYLLNQWSVSERDGNIRVATTEEPPWDQQERVNETQSGIAVLAERDDELVEVGRIDGLGVSERIQAVRYVEDMAYVVTFRQTDPLYAIDLSDPAAPRRVGELEINGYSAYLHPIDDGRLLGVGQDATDEGRTLGTQIGTFDISDPAAPTRIDAVRIDGGTSAVEYDPRAFLWWDATRTAVLPIEIYPKMDCPPGAECAFSEAESRPYMGAVAFDVGDDGSIVERGRVTHVNRGADQRGWYPITRTLVVGDALYTVSEAGVLRSDLSSLGDEGFAQFPAPPIDEGGPKPMPVEG